MFIAGAGQLRSPSHQITMLRRYWFEFDLPQAQARLVSYGLGCGVTAYGYEDAVAQMKDRVFKNTEMPPIRNVVEDVDVSTLDAKDVKPNMGMPVFRGVWFPLGTSASR